MFPNACRLCGATSYRRVLARDETGEMKPNGLYQCSGCSVVFTDPQAWRDGGPDTVSAATGIKPLTPVNGPSGATAGHAPRKT